MSSDGAGWPGDDPPDHDFDLARENLFTEELTNVDASEWDVDTADLWGAEIGDAVLGAAPFGPELLL
jgi:hypothetical protein